MANYRNNTTDAVICEGNTVHVRDGKFDQALRKWKNKVRDSGLLLDLRSREAYVKPTTRRKEKMAAGKNRWNKKLASESMPKKLF